MAMRKSSLNIGGKVNDGMNRKSAEGAERKPVKTFASLTTRLFALRLGASAVSGILQFSLAALVVFAAAPSDAQQKSRGARQRPRDLAARENDYYKLISLPTPPGVTLEAGGLEMLPDGKLAVCTRRGDVYTIENALADPPVDLRYRRFASGLHEALGLAYRDGWLYVTQRGEVSRLKDDDGDGRADTFETFADGWEIGGDYHEYAISSKFDRDGAIWVTLCLTGSFTSEHPFRGWCMRVMPDGRTVPTASGIRSPGGVGMNAAGDMFYTDNQGPWNGACGLKHLKPGGFMGNPEGNKWYDAPGVREIMGERPAEPKSGGRMIDEAARIAQLVPPAVIFPYNKMGQSASGIATDGSGGKFGPFAGQMFVGDQTHSTVMRVFLEKIDGVYQGVVFPFRQGLGSGSLSLLFAPDGSLLVGGSNRGWGSRGAKPFSLDRLVWTGETPFEVHEMRAKPDGFELTFTQPVDPASALDSKSYDLTTYTYIYQSTYGSPEVDQTRPTIESVTVADDARSVRLVVDGLQLGHVHELHLSGLRSAAGEPLLHDKAYYTLNRIPR
jgi:glucose/arabinose dehydrogenase